LLSQIIETNVEKIENKNYEWTENEVCGWQMIMKKALLLKLSDWLHDLIRDQIMLDKSLV
jgi:hypothetical protein